MIEVKAKSLGEYFQTSETARGARGLPWRVTYRHWLHPLFFLILILGLLFVLAFVNSVFLFLGCGLLGFLILSYQQYRRAALWIEVDRSVQKSVIHRRRLTVTLKIKNNSRLWIHDLVIKACHSVSMEGEKTLWISHALPPRKTLTIQYEVVADGGMGKQNFGPLQAILSDPLGLFEFRRIDSSQTIIDVLPAPSAKLAHLAPESLFSDSLGNQERPRPGDSVSFLELRNYVPGDALKKISWKLSAKFQKLLVKDFEDLISEDYTLYLDLDHSRHFGFWGKNTWEAVKEVAISILMNGDSFRRVQIISQNLEVPFASGDHHSHFASKLIRELRPSTGIPQHRLSSHLQNRLPYASSLLWVGPTFVEDAGQLIETFRLLREQGVKIRALLIDTSSFTSIPEKEDYEAHLVAYRHKAARALMEMSAHLSSVEIPFTVISYEDFAA